MKEHKYSGNFIVIEGADGSGTTTQSKKLAEYIDAEYTAEHGERRKEESLIGRKVEEMISGKGYSAEAVALGFAADRRVHLEEKIIPLLKEGKTVLCDRYYPSSLVYQPLMGADEEWVKEINRFALKPDLTIVLDIEAETGMERLEGRGKDDNIFEELGFQQEVVLRYRMLEDKLKDVEIVDGSGSKDEVFKSVKSAFERSIP